MANYRDVFGKLDKSSTYFSATIVIDGQEEDVMVEGDGEACPSEPDVGIMSPYVDGLYISRVAIDRGDIAFRVDLNTIAADQMRELEDALEFAICDEYPY